LLLLFSSSLLFSSLISLPLSWSSVSSPSQAFPLLLHLLGLLVYFVVWAVIVVIAVET
jgi:hypothetical protein